MSFIDHVDKAGRGRGVSQMSILLHKAYLEKWSTKGVQNVQKMLTYCMDNLLETFPSFDVANTSKRSRRMAGWATIAGWHTIPVVCCTPLAY